MKMTVAKALKYRNRVAEKLRKVSDDMKEHNSILAVNEPEVDVRRLDEMRMEIMGHLIAVKTQIHEATMPMRSQIFKQGELRGAIGLFKSMSTRHGQAHSGRYSMSGDELIEYKATMRKEDVDRIVAQLEDDVDNLQDELDAFNHATTIEVEIPDVIKRPYAPRSG